MASKFDNVINQEFEEGYFDQDEDDLSDFIVHSDEEDDELSKHKHQRQEELEDDMEEEEEEEEEEEVQKVEEEDVEKVEEVDEEEEEEEAPVGQQEILSLREQLKEKIRRKNAAMAAGSCKASCSSSVNQTIIPPAKDGYGTFFGPSKPVLARRVIEEGCSSIMKEMQNAPSNKKGTHLVSKTQQGAVENMQKPKFISEEKRKVDALRANRDYSSLFSDDADTPQPTKEQPDSRPTVVPKSESRVGVLVNSAGTRNAPPRQPARLLSKYNGLKAAAGASLQACDQSNAGSLGKNFLAGRKRMIAAGRNRSNLTTPGLQPSSNSQKMHPSVQSKRPQVSLPSQRKQPETQGRRMQKQMQTHRPQGNGRQQSLQGRRPDPSVQRQKIGQNGRLKSEQKQLGPSSKSNLPRSMEKRAVKRKADDDGGRQYSWLTKELFNYDPKKYIDRDEDDRNMEADFASIQKEERRSAALARREDQEQERLNQEEERRERAMKKKRVAKKEQ